MFRQHAVCELLDLSEGRACGCRLARPRSSLTTGYAVIRRADHHRRWCQHDDAPALSFRRKRQRLNLFLNVLREASPLAAFRRKRTSFGKLHLWRLSEGSARG